MCAQCTPVRAHMCTWVVMQNVCITLDDGPKLGKATAVGDCCPARLRIMALVFEVSQSNGIVD